jgi:hypothetical protein
MANCFSSSNNWRVTTWSSKLRILKYIKIRRKELLIQFRGLGAEDHTVTYST